MNPNITQTVAQGGIGTAISYLIFTVPTDWLGWLPVVPEAHYLPMVAAGGAVVTAVLRLVGLKPKGPAGE